MAWSRPQSRPPNSSPENGVRAVCGGLRAWPRAQGAVPFLAAPPPARSRGIEAEAALAWGQDPECGRAGGSHRCQPRRHSPRASRPPRAGVSPSLPPGRHRPAGAIQTEGGVRALATAPATERSLAHVPHRAAGQACSQTRCPVHAHAVAAHAADLALPAGDAAGPAAGAHHGPAPPAALPAPGRPPGRPAPRRGRGPPAALPGPLRPPALPAQQRPAHLRAADCAPQGPRRGVLRPQPACLPRSGHRVDHLLGGPGPLSQVLGTGGGRASWRWEPARGWGPWPHLAGVVVGTQWPGSGGPSGQRRWHSLAPRYGRRAGGQLGSRALPGGGQGQPRAGLAARAQGEDRQGRAGPAPANQRGHALPRGPPAWAWASSASCCLDERGLRSRSRGRLEQEGPALSPALHGRKGVDAPRTGSSSALGERGPPALRGS